MNYRQHGLFEDVLNTIARIENTMQRFGNQFENFVTNDDYFDSIKMKLQAIGELLNNNSLFEFREKYPELNWRNWIENRNFISHAYDTFVTNPKVTFQLAQDATTILKKQVLVILEQESMQ